MRNDYSRDDKVKRIVLICIRVQAKASSFQKSTNPNLEKAFQSQCSQRTKSKLWTAVTCYDRKFI
jgi:hypothetical protein